MDLKKLRKDLLERLNGMKITAKEKENMVAVIEYLTSSHGENIPRIGLRSKNDGDYTLNQYLRAGNEYDRTKEPAVQLISRIKSSEGADTGYRAIDVDELFELVQKYNVKMREEEIL